jgi:preflagellin peptidase FlaK
MIYIEALMLAIVVFVLCVATITDFKKGVIPNKILLGAGSVSIVLDILYYSLFYQSGIGLFLSDVLCIVFLAVFFYALGIWAAGDSKLLIIVAIGLPSRLYTFIPISFCPIFVLVMVVFSLAFIYSAIETLVRSIKDKRKIWKEFGIQFSFTKLLYFCITLIFMVLVILLCNIIIGFILKSYEGNYVLLILAVDFVCTLSLIELRKKMSIKAVSIASAIMFVLAVVFFCLGYFNLSLGRGGTLSIIVMLVTILVRMLAGKYNYQEISIDRLSRNMILSMGSAMRINMTFSLDKPLPMTENRKSRLTQEQVDSIKINAEKQGCSSVMIVRKLPFAIFIFLGTLVFLGLEVAYLWFI